MLVTGTPPATNVQPPQRACSVRAFPITASGGLSLWALSHTHYSGRLGRGSVVISGSQGAASERSVFMALDACDCHFLCQDSLHFIHNSLSWPTLLPPSPALSPHHTPFHNLAHHSLGFSHMETTSVLFASSPVLSRCLVCAKCQNAVAETDLEYLKGPLTLRQVK